MPDIAPGFARFGGAWLWWYHLPEVRAQVILELSAVKRALKVETVVILTAAGAEFSWPTPTDAELSRLVAFVRDAHRVGLRAYVFAGNPGLLPNSAIPSPAPPGLAHVGGRKAGETVNGYRLWWDVPSYGPDYIERAIEWYTRIGAALQAYAPAGSVAGLALCGDPHAPFATEMNVLFDEYPWRAQVEPYLDAVPFALRANLDIPISCSLLPSYWKTPLGQDPNDGMRWLASHVDLDLFDFLDVSVGDGADIPALKAALGGRMPVLSDGFFDSWADARADATWLTTRGTSGWWAWQYKEMPGSGVRGGVRRQGYLGESSGWSGAQGPMRGSTAPLRGVVFNPEVIQLPV